MRSLVVQQLHLSLLLRTVYKKGIETFIIQILIQNELIPALVYKAYQQYESLTRAEIMKKFILIEYLNSVRLTTFPGQKKVQYGIFLNSVKRMWSVMSRHFKIIGGILEIHILTKYLITVPWGKVF